MAEWLKAHAWRACVGESLPGVRISLSPFDLLTAGRSTSLRRTVRLADKLRASPLTGVLREFVDDRLRLVLQSCGVVINSVLAVVVRCEVFEVSKECYRRCLSK